MDTIDYLVKGFREALLEASDGALQELRPDRALELGRRAGRSAVAPEVWREAIGPCYETADVVRMLGISRQAVSKRQSVGGLLGLPRRGTTAFPVWQFDESRGLVKPDVRDIAGPFIEELGEIDPYVVLAWCGTGQEDLDGFTPAQWIEKGQDRERLTEAARRAAARLAR